MTKFLLIRHGAHDLLGKVLAGRAPGVHLNAQGKLEAERLAERLAVLSISAIYTGPLERARETAEPLSNRLRLKMSFAPAFDEVFNFHWRLDISPGSVSVLTIQDGQPQVLVFNSREPENRI